MSGSKVATLLVGGAKRSLGGITMSSSTTTQKAPESALASDQSSSALYVVTCRADPTSADPYDSLPLPGGDYQVAQAFHTHPAPDAQPIFTYGTWQMISHRDAPERLRGILPDGDVLIVVHGFHETAPEGVSTGLTVGLGIHPPPTQQGALRLAHAFRKRLPQSQPLYKHTIAFTWPCAHRIFPGYLLDKEEVARFAAFSLANLLADLRDAEPGRRVLLVAHSMGCFLTIKALNMLAVLRCARAAEDKTPLIVDQMVFYAADMNADALETTLTDGLASPSRSGINHRLNGYGYQALDRVGRLTVYYSYHDNALVWSPFANLFSEESGGWDGRARLGWCGPLDIASTHKNVVAVDCSACIYDHAAYFMRHEVLEHTAATLAEPAPTILRPAEQAPALQTTASDAQPRASRQWAWYTPAEIAREQWERFFLRKSRWLRRIALVLGWLLILALLAAAVSGVVALIHALIR